MQLPQSKERQEYINRVKAVEAKLKAATANGKNQTLLSQVQNEIDRLAQKYQYDKGIGKAVYKLYELQALTHYFNNEDDDALDFINQAIESRGDNYPRAEKLKARLLAKAETTRKTEPKKMSKQERRKQLIGIEGWLALFVVVMCLNLLLNIIYLVEYPAIFKDLASAAHEMPQFVADFTPALWFEVFVNLFSIGTVILIIALLMKRKRIAKTIAIAYFVINLAIIFVDYAWAAYVMDSHNLDSGSIVDDAQKQAGRAIVAVLVWVPYLLLSKRVKRTLTE